MIQKRPEPKNNNLRNHLINGITKTNGPKLIKAINPNTFRDEGNQSLIKKTRHNTTAKNVLNFLDNIYSNNSPGLLEKTCIETIGAKGLKRLYGL